MTKNDIVYVMKDKGITLPSSGMSSFLKLPNISFITVVKSSIYITDDMVFRFDMTNECLIQCKVSQITGKVITYPGTNTPCYNVYSFDAINAIGG